MQEVNFQEIKYLKFKIGLVKLNRPQALNALNINIFKCLSHQLLEWENDPEITFVVLASESNKSFSAGGDVREVYHFIKDQNFERVQEFFVNEYFTDYLIYSYKKPIISYGDGLVFGGGMGLFMASRFRVLTPSSLLSMPEALIGFFPDVGASYFLNKIKREYALLIGLTSARLSAFDALDIGLTKYLLHIDLNELISKLLKLELDNNNELNFEKIDHSLKLKSIPLKNESNIKMNQTKIESLFEFDDLLKINNSFLELKSESKWLTQCKENFISSCPESHFIFIEQLKQSQKMSRKEVAVMEYNLAIRLSHRKNFAEGVRAMLIDKDKLPKWDIESYKNVDRNQIFSYFKENDKNLFSQKLKEFNL